MRASVPGTAAKGATDPGTITMAGHYYVMQAMEG